MTTSIEFKDKDLAMLRGALACAGVKDIRYYLNGVHVTDQHVESADGHRFARFKTPNRYGWPLEKGIIIPTFKIPQSVQKAVLAIRKDGKIEIHLTDKKEHTVTVELQPIDGRFPDLRPFILQPGENTPIASVRLNPHLIYTVTKAMGFKAFCPVEIKGSTTSTPYQVKILCFPDFIFGVMPAKR